MKFKSAVLDLPPSIRTELEAMVENNKSGLAIYTSLREKYSQQTTIPTIPTLLRYMKYYREQKGRVQKQALEEKLTYAFEDGVHEVESVIVQVSSGKEPNYNKIKLLEGLAAKCVLRIYELENNGSKDPRVEAAIVRYISEVKSIVETVDRLTGDVHKDEHVLVQLIRNESREVLAAVKDVILEISPTKYELFKEKLKLRLQEKSAIVDEKPEPETKELTTPTPEPTNKSEPITEATFTVSEPLEQKEEENGQAELEEDGTPIV